MINKLTLELVRDLLYSKLGSASYIAGTIKDIVETDSVSTFAISKSQVLYYSPKFLKENIRSEDDLFTVIMHEIFHPLFGHFAIKNDKISNIAQDAFINASLYHLFPNQTNRCSFMQGFYGPTGVEGLLRPESNLENTRYGPIYKMLYTSYNKVSSSEVMEILEQLTTSKNITLLGNHGDIIPDDGADRDEDYNVKISEELLSKFGKSAGSGSSILEALREVLNVHITIKNSVLAKFAVRRQFESFLDRNVKKSIVRSPFPLNPSRTDLFMLMLGYDVIFYNNHTEHISQDESGKINVYLDVSGSVENELDLILGLMRNIRSKIERVFLFSNTCVETSVEKICKGSIQTTYGTSFDCVAQSILDNNIKKALIFTDGYAYLNRSLRAKLKESSTELMVVLFCNGTLQYDTFQDISTVVKLGDITC